MSKTILITGASGLIGKPLSRFLAQKGYRIYHLNRSGSYKDSRIRTFKWNVYNKKIDNNCIDGVDAIIHLAGEGIAEKAWTNKRKQQIIESRTESIKLLYDLLRNNTHQVKSIISASAIGFYGDRKDELLTEDDLPGNDFLGNACIAWEKAVDEGRSLGLRVVTLRTGVVLSAEGGALPQFAKPVQLGFGAALGSGKQWVSWIHLQDVLEMYHFALENSSLKGPYNMTAPNPVTNKELTIELARILGKPLWLPKISAFILKIILGEMSTVVLGSTKTSAQKISKSGFKFKFSTLKDALLNIYGTKKMLNVFWFRRDLRLSDNAGLYYALKGKLPVLPLFIFDRNILDKLEDDDDARVTFIHNSIQDLQKELITYGSSLLVKYQTAEEAWISVLEEYQIDTVFTNHDYEPYARERDTRIENLLRSNGISFLTFKDQVIFEKDEIRKDDGKPYTVYSPYKRKWLEKLRPEFHFKSYSTEKYFGNFYLTRGLYIPKLGEMKFQKARFSFPDKEFESIIDNYSNTRDIPGIEGTSLIGIHLRFGTISIRDVCRKAYVAIDKTWLHELIWREFYMMILWNFPETVHRSFKPEFDKINWRNSEDDFIAWIEGKTGYPIVDAGMRQLNKTGWMHNRVRMITASFLTKHLLIDWRWGEAYFARKLIDYEQASNVGGWQWAAGSGNDAVPYFRIFNPDLQRKKFDPDLSYIRKWVPEFDDPFKYPPPIVDHKFARERVLKAFKDILYK